ncbi:M23 family metallopeptidase [Aquimarina agarilytica]|uniref:M23 family metallopeptidase n=1 Tax=Aquimarina agarilytica TaxID=1087449 RepID=UPI0002890339|nr:M23 family metallopeptidase [Aquimarina agarilytica]
MEALNKKKGKIATKLLNKYRLVILNENTFEEQVSFKLTRLNVFVLVMITSLLLITGTIFLIAFSSLREYIPGYSSSELSEKANRLAYETDSILDEVRYNEKYYESIKKVLTGQVSAETFNKDSVDKDIKKELSSVNLKPSAQDIELRKEVERKEKYAVKNASDLDQEFLFIPPVKGSVTSKFNYKLKHYAVDIAVAKDTPVKAAGHGVVVFSEWTPDTGYVLLLKHKSGLLSVYKHNAKLLKKQGDIVIAGEVIAVAGSTGELSTGPHLHFELWDKGQALNPADYIDFEK